MTLRIHTRRLPHWESDFGTYFVTFRLADSLPHEAAAVLSNSADKHAKRRALQRLLDAGAGHCILRKPRAAEIVLTALRQFDGSRYQLIAGCVMPNHVHVVFQVIRNSALSKILYSWKSYSAVRINRQFGLKGALWQREYYDRLLRNTRELNATTNYVAENPARTGLKNWPWVFVIPENPNR